MKEFLKSLLIITIIQIITWSVFVLLAEFDTETALWTCLIECIVLIPLYLIYIPKIIKKYNLKSIRFHIFNYIFWALYSFGLAYIFIWLMDNTSFHNCTSTGWGCFLWGIEYLFAPIMMAGSFILIAVVGLIIFAIKKLIKK